MSSDTQTRQRQERDIAPRKDPLFRKLPPQYYGYALQWSFYPRWTIEEAANLLTGCVPHREMLLKGEAHRQLDAEVLEIENLIRAALGNELTEVENKRYFSKVYIDSSQILAWAESAGIRIPDDLIKAWHETRHQQAVYGYTTPGLTAAQWVVAQFWENADLRDPPKRGEIVHALLQKFPELTPEECEAVETITRHPAADPQLPE